MCVPDFKKQPLHLPSRCFFANMSAFMQLVGHSGYSFLYFFFTPTKFHARRLNFHLTVVILMCKHNDCSLLC